MATFVPGSTQWGDLGQSLGQAAGAGYIHHHDESALRKSIEALGPNPSPRDLLNAITKTKTYSNKSKQEMLKNHLGVAEFEELQRKAKATEDLNKEYADIERKKIEAKTAEQLAKAQEKENALKAKLSSADELIELSSLSREEKDRLKGKLTPEDARALLGKNTETGDYEIAKNQAKRYEKPVETYQSAAIEAQQLLPITEASILKNEAYTLSEKLWDTTLDSINSPILNPLKSKTGQELEAYTPVSISSFGQKMSGVLTNQKMNVISKKAVGLGKDKDANRLFLHLDLYDRELSILRAKFTNEIIAENKYGLPPKDFDERLKKKMLPYQKMINSDIDKLLAGKKPTSEMSQLGIKNDYKAQLQPGEVLVTDEKGEIGAIPEEELNLPENKHLKRVE